MTIVHTNTPRRAGFFRLKIWPVLKSNCRIALSKTLLFWRDPRQNYPNLTDRQAQDIGLDVADLEWRRLQMPSQTNRHPML